MVTALQSNTATLPHSGTSAATLRAAVEMGRPLQADDPAAVEQAAAQMLSELFFKPMLAEMRKFPFGRDLATGGHAEAVFGQRLDEQVADKVARGANGLTRQIVRELQRPATDTANNAQSQPLSAGAGRAHWTAAMQANSLMTRGDV